MPIDLGPLGQQPPAAAALLGVGAVSAASFFYTVSRFLLSTFVVPGKSLSTFGPKGSYALITGASDGIGKEYAFQIAAKGFNLILASRTQSKLDTIAEQITHKYPSVTVQTIAIDFSKPSEEDFSNLAALLHGKQLAILINNVGQSHDIPVPFAETPLPEMKNIININCIATLRVTQLAIPHMLPHKRGLILTMGSFGGMTPTPLLATYSGSKAFLQQWSNALAGELEPAGITVHFIHAYLITSNMSKVKRPSKTIPSEHDFVRSALSKIGNQGGSYRFTHSGTPFWSHAMVAFIVTYVVGTMSQTLLGVNRKMHIDIRKRALRKAERDAQNGKKTA